MMLRLRYKHSTRIHSVKQPFVFMTTCPTGVIIRVGIPLEQLKHTKNQGHSMNPYSILPNAQIESLIADRGSGQ